MKGESSALPQMPKGVASINLTDNSKTILEKRYLRKGENGELLESIDGMFWRVAYNIALGEEEGNVYELAVDFYKLLTEKRFFPNSPTFTGAGTPLGQLAACFVLPIADDMGKQADGIMSTLRNAALIQQTGGGNGFSFSRLRQKGAYVKSSGGTSTGPIGFMKVFDQAFAMIAQGGTRRGANMAVLRVDHPDIREFICCKENENQITNFNISVGITDTFMNAVKTNSKFDLIAPNTKQVVEQVDARELFDLIVKYAHHNGEPGVLFLDAANRTNPVPHLYELEATNPCGEQWLGPYENCCLGSVNLATHLLDDGKVDWVKLRESVELSTRFLDNVVTVNAYVESVPQLREAALKCRRIGLGIMGLADILYHVGLRYGSREAEDFVGQLMEFVRYHCMLTSVELAKKRGAFPAIKGSIYDPKNLKWKPPVPLQPFEHKFDVPSVDWTQITNSILQHGIRNAAQTTIAPTGTIATVAGCEGYGCEPVFALAYIRHVNDNGKDLKLTYTSPLFDRAMNKEGFDEKAKQRIVEEVMKFGSCQNISELPKHLKDTFVVSSDITPSEHVRMQASLQAFVDNSLSKTCNLPEGSTTDDVAACYLQAWELGCKGLTVYVTGSRSVVVLETKKEAEKKESKTEENIIASKSPAKRSAPTTPVLPKKKSPKERDSAWNCKYHKRPRPKRLTGSTQTISTPVGKAYITINEAENQPFEVFINTSKAGSETAAVSEAFGRLISYTLRIASPIEPRTRLYEVMDQLVGIGGKRSIGFGKNRVLSLPDGVAQAISGYLGQSSSGLQNILKDDTIEQSPAKHHHLKIGDLCPDCGDSALINEEGCKKCYSCGYSEC